MTAPGRNALLAFGISHRLAQWRAARYSNVRYRIEARIDAQASRLRGQIGIAVDLALRGRIILDWRAARNPSLKSLRVNGRACPRALLDNGHLIVPTRATQRGENLIEIDFVAPIATAGQPLVRFDDPKDGAAYVYSLFVPADASAVFPCFDQPDLKARLTLGLTVPAGWIAVGNAPLATLPTRNENETKSTTYRFAPTEPISTYLFAFAAGPFIAYHDRRANPNATIRTQAQADATRPIRPVPNGFRRMDLLTNLGRSWYEGVRIAAQHRTTPLTLTVSYTRSKAEDRLNHWFAPENSADPELDRGPTGADTPHNLVTSGTWSIPGSGPVLSGWRLSGVSHHQSGSPYTIRYAGDPTGGGLTGGCSSRGCQSSQPGERNTARGKSKLEWNHARIVLPVACDCDCVLARTLIVSRCAVDSRAFVLERDRAISSGAGVAYALVTQSRGHYPA